MIVSVSVVQEGSARAERPEEDVEGGGGVVDALDAPDEELGHVTEREVTTVVCGGTDEVEVLIIVSVD